MDLSQLHELGRAVREQQDERLASDVPDIALRSRLAARAEGREQRHRRGRLWQLAAIVPLLAGALFALSVVWRWAGHEPVASVEALSFRVRDVPGVVNEWIAAGERKGVALAFSDGSSVELRPRGRARILELSPAGAEVVLEAGQASVAVVPTTDSDWRVRSGPFVVDVKGTRFDVSWDAASDRFELSLHEGHVSISGCGFLDGQSLSAGQVARASCASKELTIETLRPSKAAASSVRSSHELLPEPPSSPDGAVSAEAQHFEVAPPRQTEMTERSASMGRDPSLLPTRWQDLARAGHAAEAFERVALLGFEAQCQRAGREELLLLANSARLSGHRPQARHAYGTLRSRFGGSGEAARAAFELGRLDGLAGRLAAAAVWFETYLREQPDGQWAPLALGRLIEMQVAIGDSASAARSAREYSKRFPNGPHARAAQQVLDATSSQGESSR